MDKIDYKNSIKLKYGEWRNEIKKYWFLIFVSLILILVAFLVDYLSGIYVTYKANVVNVPDLVLKYFGPYNLNFLYGWGVVILTFLFFLYPLIFKVKKLHTSIFQFSFLTILRSVFISLTHLQTPSDAVTAIFPKIFNILKFHNDQFFSGHVAFSFLGFLLFRESKIKYVFLVGSIIMGITVLAMHQHYSIDVFAAFFITYGSFKIGEWIFRKLKIAE